MYQERTGHLTCRRSQFAGAAWRLLAIAAVAAMLLPARAASAAYDSIAAAVAAGLNGTTTDLYSEQRLARFLDDDILNSLRSLNPTASDIYTGSTGIATADATAHVPGTELGAVAGAQAGFTHPPNSETIAEGIAYVADTVQASHVATDDVLSTFVVTVEIDGHAKMRDDARVQVGAVLRLTSALGEQFIDAQTWTFPPNGEYFFGYNPDVVPDGVVRNPPLAMTITAPLTLPLIELDIDKDLMTLEQLFYVRAQVGVGGGTGLAGANFLNTMQVTNIQFLNADGQVIPGVQLVGANGDPYPYNVPEPSAAAIAAAASGVALLDRRRRRSLTDGRTIS